MTTNQPFDQAQGTPDRIDRIEILLERFITTSVADRQASNERITRIEQLVESNSRSIVADRQASNERITRIEQLVESNSRSIVADRQASNERITRIEQLVESNSRSIVADRQASNERITRIEQLVESNSRSIQALNDDLVEMRLTVIEDHEQARAERAELRQATIGIANLLSSLDSDRPTILRKLNVIENKVDRILERRDDQPQL